MDNALPSLAFTAQAKTDLEALLDFIRRQPFGNPARRLAAIAAALEQLRTHPEGCRVFKIAHNRTYRVLVVDRRILIPYIYTSGQTSSDVGCISVRAVRHSAMRFPLRAVREVPNVRYGQMRYATFR